MKRASLPPLDVPVYPEPPPGVQALEFIVSMDGCDIYRKGKPPYVRPATWPKSFLVHYRRSKRACASYTNRQWSVPGRTLDNNGHPRPKEISQRVETYLDALLQLES